MSWFQKWFGLFLIMIGEVIVLFGFGGTFLLSKIRSLSAREMLSYAQTIIAYSGNIMEAFHNLGTYETYFLIGGIAGGMIFITGLVLLILAGRK